jgi:hypothetical protein
MHERTPPHTEQALQRLLDRAEIYDTLCRYVRAVDRGEWALLRAVYHPDAYDDHIEYQGSVDGLIPWIQERLGAFDNSVHLLGNCLIEFAGPNVALVETYYVSTRLRPPGDDDEWSTVLTAEDAICGQVWGRYIDRFERREGEWRIAHRQIVPDAQFSAVARGGARNDGYNWGMRDGSDPLYALRKQIIGENP